MYRKDGSVDLRYIPKIVYRPLNHIGVDGLAWQNLHSEFPNEKGPEEPTIEIDSSLQGRLKLETEIHEALHLACPWMPEIAVRRAGNYIARILWHLQYRQPPHERSE